jgi:LRR receptor-like serine/threonine-protein kinase FLS2
LRLLSLVVIEEFAYMRNVTTKVDVFSFGILIMELFTKRSPTGLIENNLTLQQFVENSLSNGPERVLEIIDPALNIPSEIEAEKIGDVLKLALTCTHFNADERPNMNEVLSALNKLNKVPGDH